jgi:TetR/AcrR family transcriptional regulator
MPGQASPHGTPPGSRRRILEAAAALFAEQGHHRTGIRDIARRARVNSQLIYYYFEDKEGLSRAVLEAGADRIRQLLREAVDRAGSPRQRLEGFVAAWTRAVVEEASTIRMLFRMAHEGGGGLLAVVRERSGRNAAMVRGLISEGVRRGEFRRDLDPRLAAASLAGMVFFLATSGPILMAAMELEGEPNLADKLARHTAKLFLRGIESRRGERPRTPSRIPKTAKTR